MVKPEEKITKRIYKGQHVSGGSMHIRSRHLTKCSRQCSEKLLEKNQQWKVSRTRQHTYRATKGSRRVWYTSNHKSMLEDMSSMLMARRLEKSTYVPIPKEGNTRECENNRTIKIISFSGWF